MPRGVQRARKDSNHDDIIEALRAASIGAKSLAAAGGGIPDVLAGFRGVNVLLEVKDPDKPPSHRPLTSDEQKFHDEWPGQVRVVFTGEEAVRVVLDHAKACGVI